ncbi:related to DNA polymerase delta subunit 4 [Lecanosticta acicola]|uniref:Related to DNA polymerase delta subunit 4 n=1 Tax=Lecanosticta acicola TaxID=111012 RepID=A0AAI8YXX8_9PEZI|nr:related to DNA polymerase delta subunit 4 [Lecanosticta acicola]
MPPKRRTTAPPTASAQRQQSTLSFAGKNSKVTKASSPRNAKSTKKDPALFEDIAHTDVKAEAEPDVDETTTSEAAIEDRARDEAPAADPLDGEVKTEDVLGGRAEESDVGAIGGIGSGWVGDEEAEARKISQAQINKYWRAKEQERKAPRVHQQDLSVHEKILREWDMSGQYGPCIGIARLKRWKRANVLGLNPPIEVLAVLLKEMDGGDSKSQRAYVDELMSSKVVET